MKILRYTFVLMLSCVFISTVHAQEIDSIRVSEGIHMITGKGGNIGVLIGEDVTFMIDDKFAPMAKAILAKVIE